MTDSTVTKYYYAGTQRIATRTGSTLTYLLGDHLGSTSLATNATGALITETRYKPWGEVRYTTPNSTLPTRYTYTGQFSYTADFGLMFYNARWYDPALGRFAQADTIVPGGVQGYDRYAYVNNNPVRYSDPSGHMPSQGCGDEGKSACFASEKEILDNLSRDADFKTETERNKCKAGNKLHCSYAENHPVETVTFTVTALVAAPLAEYYVLEGGAEASLWWMQRQVWKAGLWITGEALPAGAAYLLTKLGLDSKLSPYLIRYLTDVGTHNPESNSFVIGSYDAYIKTGQSTGSSFYSLPNTTYNILAKAGDKYWQAPNGQFMNNMMSAGKQLLIGQAQGRGPEPGSGLFFELQMIMNYWK